MTTATKWKEGDAVCVQDYAGVAFRVNGPEMVDDEDTEWTGLQVETGRIVVHMVGDDRKFYYDPDDLIALDEEDFCGGCGQMGCTWGH